MSGAGAASWLCARAGDRVPVLAGRRAPARVEPGAGHRRWCCELAARGGDRAPAPVLGAGCVRGGDRVLGGGAGGVSWARVWWRQGAGAGAGAVLAVHAVETGCWLCMVETGCRVNK